MPADDLAAPDAVGVVQDDVEGLDFGVGGEEGFGFGDGGTGGAGLGHVSQLQSKSSVRMSSKLAIRRSIWRFFVAGLTSIMLWKGAIRQPRLSRRGVDRGLDLRLVGGVGLGAVRQRAGGADEFDPRADADDMPGQRAWRSMTRGKPVRQPRRASFSMWA